MLFSSTNLPLLHSQLQKIVQMSPCCIRLNVVAMVASEATIASVSKVQKIIQNWESSDGDIDVALLGNAHLEVLFDMHNDLLKYPRMSREPKLKR